MPIVVAEGRRGRRSVRIARRRLIYPARSHGDRQGPPGPFLLGTPGRVWSPHIGARRREGWSTEDGPSVDGRVGLGTGVRRPTPLPLFPVTCPTSGFVCINFFSSLLFFFCFFFLFFFCFFDFFLFVFLLFLNYFSFCFSFVFFFLFFFCFFDFFLLFFFCEKKNAKFHFFPLSHHRTMSMSWRT